MSCRICGTTTTDAQFCVACGQPVEAAGPSPTALATRERTGPPQSAWLADQEIRLRACPRCGAPNSAARWQCARCCEPMDDRGVGGPAAPAAAAAPPTEQAEPTRWLTFVTALLGVAVAAVTVSMLVTRGVGPFEGREEPTAMPTVQEADLQVVGSSVGQAGRIVDGNQETAWRIPADEGTGWVELTLNEPVEIDHLLVANGAPGDPATTGVRHVEISFPDEDKSYRAEFLDDVTEFRVDMEDPPVASRMRIEIRDGYGDVDQHGIAEITALVGEAVATTP